MSVLIALVVIIAIIAVVTISINSNLTGTFLKKIVINICGIVKIEIEAKEKEKAGEPTPTNSKGHK
ncbi:hypothetical protein [Clostridium sp. DJ247]|uniref:hypothetical protein n=1 Tax=Clostridium sp. DJ247 TaxID=2726188 RepID=UPI001624F83F|nr:hypothetical protein [Clostridium sp. DJ247]MBC2581952.1 hypothetical protein [Clostridium sp. DJ247]